jgi:hypothetical protein
VCPKNRKAAIERKSQPFYIVSHSFWSQKLRARS